MTTSAATGAPEQHDVALPIGLRHGFIGKSKSQDSPLAMGAASPDRHETNGPRRRIDLRFALDLLDHAAQEMETVRVQAEAQRHTSSVLVAARQQVAAAGLLVDELREQLSEADERSRQLEQALANAEHRAARAALAEAELAELQRAISYGLSDGLLISSPPRQKASSGSPSYRPRRIPDGSSSEQNT